MTMNKTLRTIAAAATLLAATMGVALAEDAKPAVTTTTTTAAKPAKVKAVKPMRHAAWTKDQIKEAQEALTKGGYYKGDATGMMNKPTVAALKAWQKANKLPATGRLSDEVLTKLQAS
jgi:peptidoglycan hydrolase-like protein with peptidoglycan-binding domain